jgi:hypothetical protein
MNDIRDLRSFKYYIQKHTSGTVHRVQASEERKELKLQKRKAIDRKKKKFHKKGKGLGHQTNEELEDESIPMIID